MTRYDVHQHLWPASFVTALRSRTAPPCLDGASLVTPEGAFPFDAAVHDLDTRLAMLDRHGIDVALVSLQPTLGIESLDPGEQRALEDAWIEGIGETVARAEGRILALAPWRVLPGFAGTSVGVSALLDPERGAAVDDVDRAGGLLFVHPEAEGPLAPGRPQWWNWTAGYTAQMQSAYLAWLDGGRERWPRLRVLFAILAGGAPFQHERLALRGVDVRGTLDPGVYFDSATYGRRAIELCIETFGVERIVYGSDTPVVEPGATLAAVRGFGESVSQLLQSDTPASLLT